MYRLGHLVDDTWQKFVHARAYELGSRLRAGVPYSDPRIFRSLVECLEPPYLLLYVLHTPRGEAISGRYQSPEISREEFGDFVERYGQYLSCDGRYDIWARSPAERATVVWDRHDQIFAYGPLERYAAHLESLGFEVGKVSQIGAHDHHYRSELDHYAKNILVEFEWTYSPLHPEDEQ